MAIEPKSPRKRAAKKVSLKKSDASENTDATETKSTTKKKSASIPVPMFQSAPVAEKAARPAKKAAPEVIADETGDDDSRAGRNRRRRRGGRGRRKGGADSAETQNENSATQEEDSEEASTHRRRRRRRAAGDGVVAGESVEEDGVKTVVKVREVRERTPRVEARRVRRDRAERPERREYREPYRRRGTIITESEFLARRENVDREMVVRQIDDRIQIAVIEDKVMVEHYVNRNSNVSYVGNVYLGRVQNVLPSMEAAFVDIGKGRNAVLYAGEVNWDAAVSLNLNHAKLKWY